MLPMNDVFRSFKRTAVQRAGQESANVTSLNLDPRQQKMTEFQVLTVSNESDG